MVRQVLVIGDVTYDEFIDLQPMESFQVEANSESHARLVDVYLQKSKKSYLGATARTCRYVQTMGCDVSYAGILGHDDTSSQITTAMRKLGIQTHLIHQQQGLSPQKYQVFRSQKSEFIIRSDLSPLPSEESLNILSHNVLHKLNDFDAVVISFTKQQKLHLSTQKLIRDIISRHNRVYVEPTEHGLVLGQADVADSEIALYQGAFCLKANRHEVSHLTHISIDSNDDRLRALRFMHERFDIKHPCITLDCEGAICLDKNGELVTVRQNACEPVNVYGCGEVFFSTLLALNVYGYAIGQDTLRSAVKNAKYYAQHPPEEVRSWPDILKDINSDLKPDK